MPPGTLDVDAPGALVEEFVPEATAFVGPATTFVPCAAGGSPYQRLTSGYHMMSRMKQTTRTMTDLRSIRKSLATPAARRVWGGIRFIFARRAGQERLNPGTLFGHRIVSAIAPRVASTNASRCQPASAQRPVPVN